MPRLRRQPRLLLLVPGLAADVQHRHLKRPATAKPLPPVLARARIHKGARVTDRDAQFAPRRPADRLSELQTRETRTARGVGRVVQGHQSRLDTDALDMDRVSGDDVVIAGVLERDPVGSRVEHHGHIVPAGHRVVEDLCRPVRHTHLFPGVLISPARVTSGAGDRIHAVHAGPPPVPLVDLVHVRHPGQRSSERASEGVGAPGQQAPLMSTRPR